MKNFILIGLLNLGALALFGTEASAKVCLLRQGGSCVFWSGSVECDLNANEIGSIKKDPQSLECSVTTEEAGLLLCGNPAAKHPARVQVVTIPESFSASVGITSLDHHVATATVIASADLSSLKRLCHHPHWVALDYVPCAPTITAAVTDEFGTLASTTFACTLPNCETLSYDTVTRKFDRRQYDCTLQ